MGGLGSGRSSELAKTTVEDCLSLDVHELAREGLIRPGIHAYGTLGWPNKLTGEIVSSCGYEVNTHDASFSWIRLFYTLTVANENVDYKIQLVTTHPYFGGLRWWFQCPLVKDGTPCNRRVGKLHLPPGGIYYGCRHCYDLTYRSCQESHQFDSLYARMALIGNSMAR